MAELVGGALLGTVFSTPYEGLKEVIGKNLNFGSILEEIKSNLEAFKPLIEKIKVLYPEEVQGLQEVIQKGNVLVGKCLVKKRWNPIKNGKHANQLLKWDKSFTNELERVKLLPIIDGKKAAVSVQNIETTVRNLVAIAETIVAMIRDLLKQNQSVDIEAYCAVPELPPLTVGLDVPLNELKRKMFQDDKSIIVVSAMGGSGKTTLAIKFCRDPEVKEKFKRNIFFITVSRNFNWELIVQQLYQRKGLQVPVFTSPENAVTWLQNFVKKEEHNPFLLVLDDVWSESESVLAKFQYKEMENSKILITSRSQLLSYGSQDSQYKMNSLNGRDAMELFNHSTRDNRSHSPKLQEKIVKCCKGLPLAITVVGGSLSGQSIEIWRERVIELSKGHSVVASETELLGCLQKSLDALAKNIKKYFLDLGAFPEDKRISVGALIDMWTVLYDLTPDNAVKERCVDGLTQKDEDTVCIAKLRTLKRLNLVNLVETRKEKIDQDGYYDGDYVTQHDLLRDLAAHHSGLDRVEQRKRLIIDIRGNDIPKWWRKKNPHIQARLLSVSTDTVFSKNLPNMSLPEGEVLILNFQTKKYVLPEFVENMPELKVLLIKYDGSSHAELDNFKLLGSLPNLKTIRLESISIRSITENPFRLESLLKLSLLFCDCCYTFSNSCVKISDAFPKLEELNIDDCYILEEFLAECCDLVHLTKLSITNCHVLVSLPKEIGSLVNLEVLRLRSCTALSILPDSVENLKNLKFLDISDCSSFAKLPECIGGMSSLRKLDMRYCQYMGKLPHSVLDLKQLEEVTCSHKTQRLWEAVMPSLGRTSIVARPLNWSDFQN